MYIDPTGRVAFYGRDGGLVRSSGLSTTIITDNQWHEVTGVVSGTTGWEIYVDGVLENTGLFATNSGVGNLINFNVGNYGTSYSPIDIDQLAIWNTALSPSQILANTNSCLIGNEVNLTGLFKFNETAGTSVSDNSSTAVNGTLVNMTAPACWIAGAMNNNCTSYCDREMSQLVTVTVGDNVSPVANLSSLANINASCQVTSLTAPTATDNCAGTLTGTHNATLPISISTTITWTYNDGNGNTTTQTQLVIINDITAPVANSASLANLSSQCPITTLTAPTATDNCAGTITATHNVILPLTTNQTITWTYSDGNGNASSQTQLVLINDNTAPVATLPSLPNLTSQCQITSLTAPTANDNCAGTITGTPNVTLPLTTNQTITWTYSDGHGNASSQTQLVLINDNTAPVANVLSLATLTSQCAITTLTAPTATDNCAGTVTGTPNVTLPLIFNQTITWTYNDGQGNTSTQTQLVVVNDVTAPVANLTSLPALTDQCSITSLTAPTATDNCVGSITGTTTTTLPISSSTTIIWTYSDGNGNTTTQNQSVVINDNTSPVASAASLPDLTATCSITTLSAPTATDNCAGLLNGTTSTSLPINASMSIIWTYNDGHGNITTQNQNVIINDNIDPVPNSASLTDITSVCPVTSLTAPTATDNCAGVITATSNAIFPIAATQVITWTYIDQNANTTTQTQNVSVNDNVAPVPNSSSLPALQSSCAITSLSAPTATDNCAGQITGTTTTILPITSPGTITWTFADLNGNIITQDQAVNISAMNVNVTQVEITLTAQNSSATSYQWIDCNNGNLAISGATNQSFTAVSNGNYAVIINEGNCVDTSACFAITTVGLFDPNTVTTFTVYPNPAKQLLTVQTTNEIEMISIYALTGELIQIEKNKIFSVEKLPTGMYLIEVKTKHGLQTARFVKE
jgi:hypothetical protein